MLRAAALMALALAVAAACRRQAAPRPVARDEISVRSLLDEMGRLDHLARVPAPAFRSLEVTSHDRRSRARDGGDAWFANDDFVTASEANLVRVDETPRGKRYVLLDVDGPGAVVRIWTATPTGTLRVYIDGANEPALEAPMEELLGGRRAPFAPPFGQVTAMGYTLHFPFPYRRHCTITVDSIRSADPFTGRLVERLYYQVGYRTYDARAADHVVSYGAAELDAAGPLVDQTAARMRGLAAPPAPPGRAVVTAPRTMVAPGAPLELQWQAPPGGGQVSELRISTGERDPEKLRATVLALSFDGQQTVRAPLVDFFGTGPGWNPYTSLPMTVAADGTLTCRFAMPFGARGALTVSRDAPGAVDVAGAVTIDPASFDAGALLFHAKRRVARALPTRPFRDWHVATLSGKGRLVGTVLGVVNPPGVAWWGEGDEKISVDGEAFPSWFGTGTEDYFGYAWSSLARFAHPYHALTLAPASSFAGAFSMNRFHVIDPIGFDRTLSFDFEVWHWSDTHLDVEAILYWYARGGSVDDFSEPAE
jgi:hypothetical protein